MNIRNPRHRPGLLGLCLTDSCTPGEFLPSSTSLLISLSFLARSVVSFLHPPSHQVYHWALTHNTRSFISISHLVCLFPIQRRPIPRESIHLYLWPVHSSRLLQSSSSHPSYIFACCTTWSLPHSTDTLPSSFARPCPDLLPLLL